MSKQTQNLPDEQVMVSKASERAEAVGGVLIAVFAAFMAISDLVGNNIKEEKNLAIAKNSSYFSWYQSKSVKQSLQESHLATLESMLNAGMVKAEREETFKKEIEKAKSDIKRYKMEKKEIMEGSSTLPKEEWIQDLNGEMGVIVGVKQWEAQIEKLDKACNQFDKGLLFFQISLVLGAVCVIIYDNPVLQRAFIVLMIIFGSTGVGLSLYGFFLA
jgi:hypothetical protein